MDPAGLWGQKKGPDQLKVILEQAKQARASCHWRQAASYFEQALESVEGPSRRQISQQLRWCRAQATVEERYQDGSICQLVRDTKVDQAEALLAEIIELIDHSYYVTINPEQCLRESLLHMQAATENAFLQSQFSIDKGGLEELRREILTLRGDGGGLEQKSWSDMLKPVEALSELSEKAGLGAAWVATELAYAFCDSLDEYSHMLSPHQYKLLTDQLKGYYVGIGVELVYEGDYPTVFDVIAKGPAEEAGIHPGDILIKVGDTDLKGKSAIGVSHRLAGGQNTRIQVRVRRGDEELEFSMQRELVSSPSVRYTQLLGEEKQIGYVRIANFDHDTSLELRGAIDRLQRAGAVGLLIDIRSNGGGVMNAAIEAVRLFLERGNIVMVQRGEEKTLYQAGGDMESLKLPMAILVDKNTASAAEIFAAALKQHRRAVVIGQKTRGKAVVQTLFPLRNGPAGVCITTASYLPPDNQSFHNQGIEPDIIVENSQREEKNVRSMAIYLGKDDSVLQKGLDLLQHRRLF